MRGGKRIALSVAAALALPAYMGVLSLMPLWMIRDILIGIIAVSCIGAGYFTYRFLGD